MRSAIEPVAEISSYLLGGGGKRLRPALLLLAAGYAGYRGESAVRLGAVVELIHSATLIHDDVIDGANTRRGRPSANSRWGNHRSVLAGDWLYMQSFQMALAERNFKILDVLIELTQDMVEGELVQLSKLGREDLTEEDALELAARKTACLFAGCARLGAVLGRCGRRWRAGPGRLRPFFRLGLPGGGRHAGLHRFAGAARQTGSKRLEGRKSDASADLRPRMRRAARAGGWCIPCSKKKDLKPSGRSRSRRWFTNSGALDRSRALAQDFANRAKSCLNGKSKTDYGRALMTVPDFILGRDN